MFAVIDRGTIVGPSLYETREHAEEQRLSLGLPGAVTEVTFDERPSDPAVIKLKVKWKLEKFEGDKTDDSVPIEILEGEF